MGLKEVYIKGQVIKLKDTLKLQSNLNVLQKQNIFGQEDDFTKIALVLNWRFKYVSLHYKNLEQAGEQANLLFDLTESQIIKIDDYGEGTYIVYTDLFEVILPNAIDNKEVSIQTNNEIYHHNNEAELVKLLSKVEEMYLLGLLTIKERENQKLRHYELIFSKIINEDKWFYE
ncbi:hypothetical protein [Microscilla marina]|uniref:Uncharacterized protein n=1 Tax=Microscilla marina ATCC 23134 TaxID=313606 RepID=A1ZTD5_MICM2|nr:hypothetical protein [Microscilla marina]EAY26357.1 hypothetical protein M23134_04635 [Microscilla marina ATCC 23134]